MATPHGSGHTDSPSWQAWLLQWRGWDSRALQTLARGRTTQHRQASDHATGGLAGMLRRLGPWRATLIAAMLSAMVLPPVGLGPLVLFSFAPWIAMLPRFRSRAGAAVASFLLGWIWLLVPLYWMVFMVPLTGDNPPLAIMTVMWLLSCSLHALWFLVIGAVCWGIGRTRPRLMMLLVFPLLYTAIEAARIHWPFPGPMVYAGEALHQFSALTQIADIGGVFAVTAMVLQINGCLAAVLDCQLRGQRNRARFPTIVMLVAFLAVTGYGALRISQIDAELSPDGPMLVLVQPNVGQEQKNREAAGLPTSQVNNEGLTGYEAISDQFRRLQTMSLDAKLQYPELDLLVWPETAMPGKMPPGFGWPDGMTSNQLLSEESRVLKAWNSRVDPVPLVRDQLSVPLLFGVEVIPSAAEKSRLSWLGSEEADRALYNSAVLLDPAGQAVHRHDKRKLVPAGEYIPYRGTPLGDFTAKYMQELAGYVPRLIPGDGVSGPEDQRFAFTGRDGRNWRFSVGICYEYAFPDLHPELHGHGSQPVHFMANLSNEAWYGRHAELDQAHIKAKFRAIENRASYVRATNSGISGMIDPVGREVSRLREAGSAKDRLFAGLLASHVPVLETPKPTWFQSRFAQGALGALQAATLFAALWWIAAGLVASVRWWLKRRVRNKRRSVRSVNVA